LAASGRSASGRENAVSEIHFGSPLRQKKIAIGQLVARCSHRERATRGIDPGALLKCIEAYCRTELRAEVTASLPGVRLLKPGGTLARLGADPELRHALEVLLRAMG
jgi:hypothetical protein